MGLRLLVTRPTHEAQFTAQRLIALGHTPLLAPVLDIVALAAPIPPGRFSAALATSAHAFGKTLPALAPQLYVVGEQTARAALAAGWAPASHVALDAAALAAWIIAAHSGAARFLYLAGRERKPTLERDLRAAGHHVAVVETYAAQAAMALPPSIIAAAKAGAIDAALHYSRRSAEIFVDLIAAAAITAEIKSWRHYCLSDDVALALGHLQGVIVAEAPHEAALLRLLP